MITITIDIPPRILSPNGTGHWAQRSAAKKSQRQAGYILAIEAMNKAGITDIPWKKPRVELAWFAGQRNWVPDVQNAIGCVKALIDGVEDSGLFVNDKDLEWGRIIRDVDKEYPRVVLSFDNVV